MRARFFSEMSPNRKLILLVFMGLFITVLQHQTQSDLDWQDCAEAELSSYETQDFSDPITYKTKEPCNQEIQPN